MNFFIRDQFYFFLVLVRVWFYDLFGFESLADINGDALHSSVGFPPALNVTTAKVGKLEIVVGDC